MIYGNGFAKGGKNDRRKRGRDFPLDRFKRTLATVQIQSDQSKLVEGRVFLNDLTPAGMGLFIRGNLKTGDSVSIAIHLRDEKQLYVKGEVVWCIPYALNTKVLSNNTYPYRVGVRFVFEDANERKTVADYCESIALTENAA